jgi:cell division initiation protein
MKVTPLEIRQKQFEKKTFGGIDKDEVQAFLNALSLAWEKMQEDYNNLKGRLDQSEQEVLKLREAESALYKTLKTAEETSQKAIDQANQQGKLIVQEAKLKAETMHQEAKWKATKAMEQAEDYSRKSYDKMVQDVKILEKDFRSIENLKENFLSDIKIIAQDLLEKAERANQRSSNIEFKVPPPPELDFFKPKFEEEQLMEVIQELEIPENQQTIAFVIDAPKVEIVEEKPVPDVAVTDSVTPTGEYFEKNPIKNEPEKVSKTANESDSFFDRIG